MLNLSVERTNEPIIRLNPADNVAIAKVDIEPGTKISEDGIVTRGHLPAGYKVAIRDIAKGEAILKYSVIIGFSTNDLPAGKTLDFADVAFQEFDRDYAYSRDYQPVEMLPESERATFEGYVREDGRAGTRNYVAIVSSVNCSATVVHEVADYFTKERLKDFPNVDGVAAFAHSTGCGMEMTGEPMALLQRTLAGYIRHANVGAALLIGLGCERCQVGGLLAAQGLEAGPRLKTLVIQELGGSRRTIEEGIKAVEALLPIANACERETVSASQLSVALQCGGSDSFSSITANPSLGEAVNILARHGGTGILAETPEVYGSEHLLTARARTPEVGEKLVERLRWWKEEYATGRDVQINGRVSPGNVAGGLANILEKSLGSAMKGGTGPLMEVYKYAERVTEKGFVFMDSPGYDPVSVTGQIASGANLVAFTTGRGSCFGAKPVPSVKLATNTPMFQRMEEDMDINCGQVLDDGLSLEEMGQQIFDYFLEIASGKKSKSETLGFGRHEFAPWQIGITG